VEAGAPKIVNSRPRFQKHKMVHQVVERLGNYKRLAWWSLGREEQGRAKEFVRGYISKHAVENLFQICIPSRFYIKKESFFTGSAKFVSCDEPIYDVLREVHPSRPYVIINAGEHYCVAFVMGEQINRVGYVPSPPQIRGLWPRHG
jgi:hypothetical protein